MKNWLNKPHNINRILLKIRSAHIYKPVEIKDQLFRKGAPGEDEMKTCPCSSLIGRSQPAAYNLNPPHPSPLPGSDLKKKGGRSFPLLKKNGRKVPLNFPPVRRLMRIFSTAASSRRGDRKSLTAGIIVVINLVLPGVRKHSVINQQVNFVNRIELIIIFRLIQSQSQFGSASAISFKKNPEGSTRLLLQHLLDFVTCQVGNLQHDL